MRLVSGNGYSTGRVEVNYLESWGTVCGIGFNKVAARVVCKQLGFPDAKSIQLSSSYYGSGSGTVFLGNVQCTGNETSIAACRHSSWGGSGCSHSNDVGVVCISNSKLP